MKIFPTSLCAFFLLAAAAAAAAAKSAAHILPGSDLELKTQDGWVLKAKYLPAKPGQKTFVLLHGKGQRKEFWIRLAGRLGKAGYGYLAPDLRGHGQSATDPEGQPASYKKFRVLKSQNDFANMSMDVEAAVSALVAQYVQEETIGIIGTDVGGSVGLKYAALHPAVPMVVLLSPGMSYQEVLTVNAVRAYKDRPLLMIYGELDKTSGRETPILYEFAKRSAGERKATMVAVPNRQGVRLLTGPVIEKILDWISSPVKSEAQAASTSTVLAPKIVPTGGADDTSSELILEP